MNDLAKRLKAYIDAHPFEPGDSDCETVLDQLHQAYAESRESDPPEIQTGFAELENFLETLPLDDIPSHRLEAEQPNWQSDYGPYLHHHDPTQSQSA